MVNTFIVSDDYESTAKILDYKRLGKQRVEAMQLINVLENSELTGWKNHPATKQWRGHVNELKKYTNEMIKEWIRRGYKNTMKLYDVDESTCKPWFITWKPMQYSHMASLIRKNKEYYKPYFYKKYPIVYEFYTYLWVGDWTKDDIQNAKSIQKDDDLELLKEYSNKVQIQFKVIIKMK
jgi:hypothetical protein